MRYQYGLALLQIKRRHFFELHLGPVAHCAPDRLQLVIQRPRAAGFEQRFELGHCHHVMLGERPGAQTSQRHHMPTTAQQLAEILGDSAHIGALAAVNIELHLIASVRQQIVAIDVNVARSALHFNALSREFVKRLATMFDGRIHGRNLVELAGELKQSLAHLRFRDAHRRALGNDLAFSVAGLGAYTQLHGGEIALVCVEQILR